MKKTKLSIMALIIAIVITLGIFLYFKILTSFTTPSGSSQTIEGYNLPTNDTAFGTLFASLTISDSVPHYVYKKAEDSHKKITDLRDFENKGIGSGISFGSIGVV